MDSFASCVGHLGHNQSTLMTKSKEKIAIKMGKLSIVSKIIANSAQNEKNDRVTSIFQVLLNNLLTLTLLNSVPVTKNTARVSMSIILFGDLAIQNMNSAKKVTNGKNGRAASIGVRILPVLYLYDLYMLTTTMGTLDKALTCSKNSNPNPSGMPNGSSDCFQYAKVPNHVVKNMSVDPHIPKS